MSVAKRVCSEDQVNAMAAKTIVKASLPSLHDKLYPSLGLCVPQAISEDSTFAIAIINYVFIIIIIITIIIINEFYKTINEEVDDRI